MRRNSAATAYCTLRFSCMRGERSPEEILISVMKKRKSMRFSKVAALVLMFGATSLVSVSLARAASDCPTSVTVSDWGENSTGYFNVASGGSCLFPIRMAGAVSSSEISQKPAHGKLNISTYEYTAKARYKGSDTFAIKATGKGPTASGTSVITVHATIQ
jgi:hypothetical protein